MTAKKANPKEISLKSYSLQGRCFITYDVNNKLDRQGIVHSIIPCQQGDLVLVQYFEWIAGEPDIMELVPLAKMVKSEGAPRYKFFEDAEHMRFYIEYR